MTRSRCDVRQLHDSMMRVDFIAKIGQLYPKVHQEYTTPPLQGPDGGGEMVVQTHRRTGVPRGPAERERRVIVGRSSFTDHREQ